MRFLTAFGMTRRPDDHSPPQHLATPVIPNAVRNLKLVIGSAARNLIDWLPSARAAPFAIARNDARRKS